MLDQELVAGVFCGGGGWGVGVLGFVLRHIVVDQILESIMYNYRLKWRLATQKQKILISIHVK